jgi:hypothetical protein
MLTKTVAVPCRNVAAIILACLAVCLPLVGQMNFAVLHGTIQDPQNQPVLNAQVTVIAADTGARRAVMSDATGWFEVVGLSPGEYQVEALATGFKDSRTSVKLEVGQQMSLNLMLSIG